MRPAGGSRYVNLGEARRGADVFQDNCAGCHSNGQPPQHNVWSDDLLHVASGFIPILGEPPGDVGTNECRSLTTNWMAGHIWAGPLLGVWATAPFFHNNRLGSANGDPSLAGRVAAFEDAYDQLVNPWKRNELGSVQVTTAAITVDGITLPAGTPVALFANLDLGTGKLLCGDVIENGGHYFGALLPDGQKKALREYLKTL
jgi:hypothetical protein